MSGLPSIPSNLAERLTSTTLPDMRMSYSGTFAAFSLLPRLPLYSGALSQILALKVSSNEMALSHYGDPQPSAMKDLYLECIRLRKFHQLWPCLADWVIPLSR